MSDQSGIGNTRIRILDESTVTRISAGEVVERASSVVKELVENAIDAGAGRIGISIRSEEGRITSIRVTDDGCGMGPEDACLAFARFATSKISVIGDLPTCRTLGFRGEALASIAAVARVILATRSREGRGISGTRIINKGGQIQEVTDAGCPPGTTVTVEDLFFNTPARDKFQKPASREIPVITGMIERLAVTRPGIAFELDHNNRTILSVHGTGDLMDTITSLYGLAFSGQLIRIEKAGERVGVAGYLSRPTLTRKNQHQMYLSVNRRVISSRLLAGAVREGYGTLLPAGRYPVAFLDISLALPDVDVNVHPAKREVRLGMEDEVKREVAGLIRERLSREPLVPEVGTGPAVLLRPDPTPFPGYQIDEEPRGVRESLLKERIATGRQLSLTGRHLPEPAESLLPALEIIGQLGSLYILAGTHGGDLFIIDQHAAHERVLYEQVGERSMCEPAIQELIEPLVLTLSPRESETLAGSLPRLATEGFLIEGFGPGIFLVRGVPVILGKNIDPREIREIIAEIIAPGQVHGIDAGEAIRRIVACRGAIKAGADCSHEECRQLVEQLARVKNPFTCPHGRPTMLILGKSRLDELFKRG